MNPRRLTVCAAIVLGSSALSACGSNGGSAGPTGPDMTGAVAYAKTPAKKILADAQASGGNLHSFRISLTQKAKGSPVNINVLQDGNGHCEGSVTIGNAKIEVVETPGGHQFVTSDQAGITALLERSGKSVAQAKAGASLIAGKWITGFSDITGGLCSSTEHRKQAFSFSQSKGSDATAVLLNGVPAVRVNVTQDGKRGQITVSASAPHYALKIEVPTTQTTIFFSDFNAPVATKAPANAVDMSSFQH